MKYQKYYEHVSNTIPNFEIPMFKPGSKSYNKIKDK